MKKHTGWHKIMKGVAKAQTPTASNKRQTQRFFSTAKVQERVGSEVTEREGGVNNPVLQVTAMHPN